MNAKNYIQVDVGGGVGLGGIVRIQRSDSSLSMICRHIEWRHGSRKRGFQHVGFTLIVSSHLIWLTVSNPPFPQPPFYPAPKGGENTNPDPETSIFWFIGWG